jgi:hypothetical protein
MKLKRINNKALNLIAVKKYYNKNKKTIAVKREAYYKRFRSTEYGKAKHKEWSRKSWIKQRYGLTVEEYEELKAKANGKCNICKKELVLHLDHNHKTGKVREFICPKCNLSIGVLEHDLFIEYIKYLLKHED